ncbi:PREDICTED: XIAP-associated factor 1 isoform X3 [Propithecus coquereli]|uniref:XIAP-associated factor 1 isoform X3 n=1 Tax=Propithecus coquereli TaxID=379532 RepID=UPI00063FB870|nr:PREDICTED: XIAP-associated factor 1 isoform X3 [Propithecus coquereli]
MEGAFQVCRNCKRKVASAHFTLHEVHCLRFLVLCPECEEAVPGVKMEEHCKNSHRQVGCAMCQQSVQKPLLEFHEAKECQERPTECKFCKLAVRLSKLEVHEFYCGKRTELCPDCGQSIMLEVLAQHKDVCRSEQAQLRKGEHTGRGGRGMLQGPEPLPDGMRGTETVKRTDDKGERISAPGREISCHYCNQMIPENEYFHHMKKCCPNSEFEKHFPVGKLQIPPPSLPSQAAENQTSTTEQDVRPKTKNINRFPLLSESSSKQAPRGKNKTVGLPSKSEFKTRTTSSIEDEAAYDILRRCPQCGILLPLPTLNQHQEKCWWLASSKGKQVRNSS